MINSASELITRKIDVKAISILVWVLVASLSFLSQPAVTDTYDVGSDFSATSNPAGAWSYGWSSTLTGSLSLYSFNGNDRGIDIWSYAPSFGPPTVSHNGTSSEINLSPETISYLPGQFALHPGGAGEYSHARWTAAAAGTYNITAIFSGIDHTGTTTDVHVLHNTTPLFDGTVVGFADTASYAMTVSVEAGDFIGFAVGYGNGAYWDDSTALAATISDDVTGMTEDAIMPHSTRLIGTFPNPFNPFTRIIFDLTEETYVRLRVYDVNGVVVRTLIARRRAPGRYTEIWDGRNETGTQVTSGVYFVRLHAANETCTMKIVLAK